MGEPSVGRAKQYRGDSSEVCYSQSPWFCSDDIPSESWEGFVVQIEDVLERAGVKFTKGRSRESELTLKFRAIEKELVVNITNRRQLDAMFSKSVPAWLGKWITLYVQTGVRTGDGEVKNGIRIRFQEGGARPPTTAPKSAATKPASEAPPTAAPKAAPAGPAKLTVDSDLPEVAGMRRDVWNMIQTGGSLELARVCSALGIPIAGKKPSEIIVTLTAAEIERVWLHSAPLGGQPLPSTPNPTSGQA